MRRLGAQEALSAPAIPPRSNGNPASPGTALAGALVVEQRVVTLSQLDGKLQGIRRLIVPANAVVTPSVRDLLRQKQVRLEQQVQGATARSAGCGLLAIEHDTAGTARRLADSLSTTAWPWETCDTTDGLIRRMQQATPARPVLGLAVTPAWARLVCEANRAMNLQAVAVVDQEGLQQACDQLEVNLLVLDPTRHTEAEILALGHSYLQRCASATNVTEARKPL